jgi:ribosomal protein L11 methylase PrmA
MRAALPADGVAILSGILREERERMIDAITGHGFVVSREDVEDAWWTVTVRPA